MSSLDEKAHDVETTSPAPPSTGSHDGVTPDANVDSAWKFLNDHRDAAATGTGVEEPVNIDKLRHKIDWRIVPLMFCCYTMQFLDKVILNVSHHTS